MATSNQTQITPPRVPIIEERTGAVSRQWYRWFYSLYTFTGEGTGILPVTSGGTGLGTIPTNGQLLIGNGTGYTLNTLGAGAGISVTNGAGTSTVANTGVLSVSGGTTGLTPAAATTGVVTLAGTLKAVNGGTGFASYVVGNLLYADTTTTLAKLASGTGVITALGVNVGTVGAVVVNGGALGTPSSGTVTNLTGTASININGTVGATTANTGAFTALSATGKVTAASSSTATGADESAGKFDLTANTATTTFGQHGVYGTVSVGASFVGTGGINGARGAITIAGAGTTIGTMTGVLGGFNTTAASTVTLAACFRTALSNSGGTTFTTISGFHASDHSAAATTVSGFYGEMTTGTNKWNLYMTGTAPNWFRGDVLVFGAGGLGYTTGSGGAVTQGTSRTTGVTLSKSNGAITMFSDLGSAVAATFTVTNTLVAATDTIILNQKSGTNLYVFLVTAVAAGSFNITFYTTGGIATDAPVINFAVIKAVTA